MIERDWSKPLNLELIEPDQLGIDFEKVVELPISMRHFSGAGVETMKDHDRLNDQHYRIKKAMKDGVWRTLEEIADLTHDPVASISAQLRHLRKIGFGSHTVNKQHRGPSTGLWEYQLILNPLEAEAEARRYFYKKHPKPFEIVL